jgi:transposase
VKPYVKRQKNDATDAEAICEAVTRANMRFVATKTPEQQSGLTVHRTRVLGAMATVHWKCCSL